MDTWQRISGALFLSVGSLSVVDVGALQAQSGATVPALQTILNRMAQTRAENRTHLRPYGVVRDYRLFGKEKQTTKAEVIADVTFVPPDVKHYAIRQQMAWD